MRVAFLTAGDPARLTGGYLYHARVFDLLCQRGVVVDQIVVSVDPSLHGQDAVAREIGWVRECLAQADVVVVDALAAVACRFEIEHWQAERPLVAMVHELPSVAGGLDDPRLRDAEQRLLTTDLVITVSQHGARLLAERGVVAERIRVVSPGADRIRQKHAIRSDGHPRRVLSVAQWIPRKGIDTLVAAWGRLHPDDAVLELIGETDADPAYAERVQRAIAGAGDSIVIHGAVDDATLAAAFGAADLFVLPSNYEGYGMVFAEALLHGIPVIAGDVGPVPELVGPHAGLLVPPGDDDALASAIDRVLTDDGLRQRLADGARQRGRELPTWADAAEGFHAALLAAIQMRSG